MSRTSAEILAERFHTAYERLAPSFSYRTRQASAVPWAAVPEQNKALMVAVCAELLQRQSADLRELLDEPWRLWTDFEQRIAQ